MDGSSVHSTLPFPIGGPSGGGSNESLSVFGGSGSAVVEGKRTPTDLSANASGWSTGSTAMLRRLTAQQRARCRPSRANPFVGAPPPSGGAWPYREIWFDDQADTPLRDDNRRDRS